MSYRTTQADGNIRYEAGSPEGREVMEAKIPDPIEPDPPNYNRDAADAYGGPNFGGWELVNTAVFPRGKFHFTLFWTWKEK